MQEAHSVKEKMHAAMGSEIDRKIAKLGEVQFIMDEKNSLQEKLTALETRYFENNRELAVLRKENAQLNQDTKSIKSTN